MHQSLPRELLRIDYRSDPSAWLASYRHSWSHGEKLVEPNRFFDSYWYALHNSDWSFSPTPFEHYVRAGLQEDRDPSAFVDFSELKRSRPGVSNRRLYARLLAIGAGPSDGVYGSTEVLRHLQKSVLRQITPLAIRTRSTPRRKNLLFIQNASSQRITEWARDHGRSFDILANHYNSKDLASSADADVRVFQVGTKFTAVAKLSQASPELLDGYRFMMFLDDDIALSAGQIEAAFQECETLDAAMAQPALSPDSECAWPDLFRDVGGAGALRTNTVEVMMPIFSGDFFRHIQNTFQLSVSGFGLDLLWGDELRSGEIAWRLGSVTAKHERPVDRAGGAYYRFLRDNHINPRAELWSLIKEFGLRRSIARWPLP